MNQYKDPLHYDCIVKAFLLLTLGADKKTHVFSLIDAHVVLRVLDLTFLFPMILLVL